MQSEKHEPDCIDDTEKVLENLKKNQSTYNDDNLEISKSPKKLNRFDALQLEDDTDGKLQAELNIYDDQNTSYDNEADYDDDDEDDDDDDEEEDKESGDENPDEDFVEPIREDIFAYEKSTETKKKNLTIIVNREELIYLLRCLYVHKTTARENILTIGMVITKELFLY